MNEPLIKNINDLEPERKLHKKRFILFLVKFLWAFLCFCQNPHPPFRNYTTEHGLPSPEVHYCLEDSLGYMWFATDNGLSRFDGYGFKNYGLQEGLNDPVVFHLQLDSKNRLWIATLSGKLFFLEKDSIHVFVGNKTIQELGHAALVSFFIGKNDELYLSFAGIGLLLFDKDGQHRFIRSKNPMGANFLYRSSLGWLAGNTICPDSLRDAYLEKYRRKGVLPSLEFHDGTVETATGKPLQDVRGSGGRWVWEYSDSQLLFYCNNNFYVIEDQKVVSTWQTEENTDLKSLYRLPDSSLLVGHLNSAGLHRYHSLDAWRRGQCEQWLPGKSISHIFGDSRGGLWVSTLEHGVFHFPDAGRNIYDQSAGLPDDHVAAIALGAENELFIGFRNGQVFHLSLPDNQLTALPKLPLQEAIHDLIFDKKTNTLWAANGRAYNLVNGGWRQLSRWHSMKKQFEFASAKKFSLRQGSRQLWTGASGRFNRIDLNRDTYALNSDELGIQGRTFVVCESSSGHIWVGRPDGFWEFKDNQLVRPEPLHPAFKVRVDDLAELPNGTLVIATKGGGLLLWRDTFFLQLTTKDGLITNMMENLHVDERGRIWAGSLLGLNRVSLDEEYNPTIERFTTWHGLPSNEITMVLSSDDNVWVATTKGLMLWREPQNNNSTKPPIFEGFEINGVSMSMDAGAFAHDENNLTFHYLTLNFDQAGHIPYRFRLNDGQWNFTEDRTAGFVELPPGFYRFEVQSKNENGVWSQSLIHPFTIRSPWWRQWWFYLLGALAVAGGFFAFLKYRTGLLKKEIDLQKQLAEAERQALQAQMNPHFIFNCLSSIRQLILDQDGENAIVYLSNFSKLVRATLQSSRNSLITLEDEVEALENYLELEQLRYKDVFSYRLEVDSSIDQFDIVLPPALIQPYVENALVHGMSTKSSGGLVSVRFSMVGNDLLATITDNGPGINHAAKKLPLHQSVGMSLTQRRLELLHGESSSNLVTVSDILGKNGEVLGTRVAVIINQPV